VLKTLTVLGLLVVSANAIWAQSSGNPVRHHRVAEAPAIAPGVAQAEAAIDKKDYAAAEPLLKQAVAEHADDYRAWFDLGFVLNALGRKDDAVAAYRKSVTANPKVFESNLNLGLLLAQAGSPEAATFLQAATQLKPTARPEEGWERAWLSLGRVLENSNPAEAIAAYRRAARLQPGDPEPRLAAALLLEKRGDMAAAEEEYQRAADLDAKSSEALAGLVNVYQKTGRMPQAEAALRKYLQLQPSSGAGHVQLGRVLAAQGKRDQAAAELQAGIRLSRDDPAALRDAATLLTAANQYRPAEDAYRMLLQRNPTDAEAHAGLGSVLMHQRNYVQAQKELLAAVELNPRLGEAYGDLAAAASENKDYVLALRALEARARLLPENAGTYFLRATAFDHLRDAKQAAANYRQFLAVANGKFPDQEWQARHRLKAIEPKK
jgi:tetratricopeptide (TPR) repeat protein